LNTLASEICTPLVATWQTDNITQINSFVTIDNSNRFRISTKFTLVKIFVFIGLFSVVFNLVREIHGGTLNEKAIIGLTLGTIALIAIFYFVNTRKRIDYDDIKQTLYVVDTKNHTEIEVPVENINKILYSSFGGRGTGSYVILYRDFHNQQQKARLFPIPFDNTIDTIKTDAQLKNPNLVMRNWSVGWNDLFD
jgi:hypothetical protein